jgi:nitrate reductase gamma subunit
MIKQYLLNTNESVTVKKILTSHNLNKAEMLGNNKLNFHVHLQHIYVMFYLSLFHKVIGACKFT